MYTGSAGGSETGGVEAGGVDAGGVEAGGVDTGGVLLLAESSGVQAASIEKTNASASSKGRTLLFIISLLL